MNEPRLLTVIYPRFRFLTEYRETGMFTPIGGNLYRNDEGFLCGRISFGDIFEAYPTNQENVVTFRRRVHRAGQRRGCFIIPPELVKSPRFQALCERIRNAGGFSAVDARALFLVFLPKTCDLKVDRELDKILGISPLQRRLLDWKCALRWQWHRAKAWLTGKGDGQLVIRRR